MKKKSLPRRFFLIAINLVSVFGGLPAAAQTITVTPYSALGAPGQEVTQKDPDKKTSTSAIRKAQAKANETAAYQVTVKDYPLPGGSKLPQQEIWATGPTFDATAVAYQLLRALRAAAATGAPRALLTGAPDSYPRQLLLPSQPTTVTEQAIEQGFLTALARQFATRYPAVATLNSVPDGKERAASKRQAYAIKSPLDLPRYVKPGSALVFTFDNLNWLKYTAEVDGKAYERQFSIAAEFDKAAAPATPAAGGGGADAPAPPQSLADLFKQIEALDGKGRKYKELVEALSNTYQADYWPNALADEAQRTQLVKEVFSTSTISAQQFIDKPQQLQKDLTTVLTSIGGRVIPPGTKTFLDHLQAYLKETATEAYQKQIAVLGNVLVKLQVGKAVRPSSTLLLPEDKDEVDVTVEYKLRSDYQQPPGLAIGTLPKQSVTILLLPRFRITGSVGPYWTGLVDHRFSFVNDSIPGRVRSNAADTTTHKGYLARKKIVRQNDDEWFSGVGASVFINFEYRLKPGLGAGIALGVGAQNDGLRLLLGPALLLGNTQRAVLSAGIAGGRVTRLANGYGEGHEHAIKDLGTSEVPTRVINITSWYVGLSYNLSSSRK